MTGGATSLISYALHATAWSARPEPYVKRLCCSKSRRRVCPGAGWLPGTRSMSL